MGDMNLSEAMAGAETAAVETTTAPNAMQVAGEAPMANGLSGDITSDDFRIPTLNIVQSVGPLSENFTPGDIVLNKKTVLSQSDKKQCPPIDLTVVAASKKYVENLEFGSETMPQTVETLEEVKALGGTIKWGDNGEKPSWIPVLNCLVLVKGSPDDPDCNLAIGEDYYAAALWSLRSSAYNRAGKNIITSSRTALRDDSLSRGKWSLMAKREKLGKNFVFVPVLTLLGKHEDSFVEAIDALGLAL